MKSPAARIVSFSQAPRSTVVRMVGGTTSADREPRSQHLTARELEVLALLCEGLPNKVIQRRLDIGAGTVKCHVGSILSKLGVCSRLQAVISAQRIGLLKGSAHPQCDGPKSGSDVRDAPVWIYGRPTAPLQASA